ncbi:hypothetical protein RN001_005776 [Aquatica leii]|uniref:Mutator-like transposase domain-containing protein n=1 Tax=Aquatica leii TaxID=1421715 RepID=A0AAN7Q1R6_9COLE|nr:hypothetical protein RN001_005776 [Aquatica leii]
MPKSRLPISQRKRSRSKRAKTVKHLWCLRKENQPDVIPTMTDNEYKQNIYIDFIHSPILLKDLEDVWNIKSTTDQTNKDPWGSDTEYNRIVAEELQIEADQPEEPAISGKRIVNIGFLEQVIQLSENHARSCTTGRLNIDKEIRSGLKSTIILKCIMCEKTFSCSAIDKKVDINKEAVWGTFAIGSTYKHTEEFLSVMNIPPLSGTTFYTIQDELSQVI